MVTGRSATPAAEEHMHTANASHLPGATREGATLGVIVATSTWIWVAADAGTGG